MHELKIKSRRLGREHVWIEKNKLISLVLSFTILFWNRKSVYFVGYIFPCAYNDVGNFFSIHCCKSKTLPRFFG